MNQEIISKAADIVEKNVGETTYCALGLIDSDGYPTVSTISAAKADGINSIMFCTGLTAHKIDRIGKCNKASVCVNSMEYNITLVGTIEVITNPAVKKEIWYDGLDHNFSGYDDPNYCVLKFKTEKYNLFVDWQELRGAL